MANVENSHSLLSPSSAHRWMNCTASVDACRYLPKQESSVHALKGSDLHELAYNILTGKSDRPGEPIKEIETYLEYVSKEKTSYLETKFFQSEEDSDYRLFGTIDAVLVRETGIEIVDLKTGSIPVYAQENPQLLLYAVLVSEYFQKEPTKLTIIQHERIDSWDMPQGYLGEFRDKFLNTQMKIKKRNVEFLSGEWCRYCPFKDRCNEYLKDVQSVTQFKPLNELSVAEMRTIFVARKKLNDYIDSVESILSQKIQSGELIDSLELKSRSRRVWSSDIKTLIDKLKEKEDFIDYIDLASLGKIEKFDRLFVESNTIQLMSKPTLTYKAPSEDVIKFTPVEGN